MKVREQLQEFWQLFLKLLQPLRCQRLRLRLRLCLRLRLHFRFHLRLHLRLRLRLRLRLCLCLCLRLRLRLRLCLCLRLRLCLCHHQRHPEFHQYVLYLFPNKIELFRKLRASRNYRKLLTLLPCTSSSSESSSAGGW